MCWVAVGFIVALGAGVLLAGGGMVGWMVAVAVLVAGAGVGVELLQALNNIVRVSALRAKVFRLFFLFATC